MMEMIVVLHNNIFSKGQILNYKLRATAVCLRACDLFLTLCVSVPLKL